MNLFQIMAIAGLLVGGMGVALLGSIKVSLARKLQMDEARVGGLVSVFGFAVIPVMLTAGFVTDLIGKQVVLVGGSALLIGSLVVLARAKSYRSALVAVLMFSAAWAAMVNVLNVLVPLVFPGNITSAMNMANVYYGVGALLTPLVVAFLLRQMSLTSALLVLAALVLAPPVLALLGDFAALTPVHQEAGAAAELGKSILTQPIVWLGAFAVFFYTPLEAATAAWTTTYLGDKGISERFASWFLSAFWLSYMSSRLVTAFCLPAGGELTLIVILSLACIVVLAGIVVARGRALPAALVVAAGLAFGPIFPTLMAIVLGHMDPSLHGRVVGMVFAVGGVGWTAIPMLMGNYARRTSVQRSFLVAVGSAVGMCAVIIMLAVHLSP